MTEILIVLALATLLGLAGFLLYRSSSGGPAPRPPRRARARRPSPAADRRQSPTADRRRSPAADGHPVSLDCPDDGPSLDI